MSTPIEYDKKTLRVTSRECDHREFKLKFDNKKIHRYAKTIVAFANRDGGDLIFGVKDRPRDIIGQSEKEVPDELVLSHFLTEYFEPAVNIKLNTITINDDKQILVITVEKAIKKPIICKKEKYEFRDGQQNNKKQSLRCGAVYYRYSSSTEEIKYAELKHILDDEVSKTFHSLVDNITLLQKIGLDRSAIIDATELNSDDNIVSVHITNETAKNMNWIDHGRFSETKDNAEKAYYVVKQVEIKQGIEISKPTDFSKSHPMTKTELSKKVKIGSNYLTAVIWKLGILNNPVYHIAGKHGKNTTHKFTKAVKDIILTAHPLEMLNRKETFIQITRDYCNRIIKE